MDIEQDLGKPGKHASVKGGLGYLSKLRIPAKILFCTLRLSSSKDLREKLISLIEKANIVNVMKCSECKL